MPRKTKKDELISLAEKLLEKQEKDILGSYHHRGDVMVTTGYNTGMCVRVKSDGRCSVNGYEMVYGKERDYKAESKRRNTSGLYASKSNREMGMFGTGSVIPSRPQSSVEPIYKDIWRPRLAKQTIDLLKKELVLDLLAES